MLTADERRFVFLSIEVMEDYGGGTFAKRDCGRKCPLPTLPHFVPLRGAGIRREISVLTKITAVAVAR
jgi:hypothetical protein